jgi:hypothetical protein
MSNSTALLAALNAPAYDVVRDEIRASLLAYAKRMMASYQKEVAAWVPSSRMPVHCRHMDDYRSFPKCRINGNWIDRSKVVAPEDNRRDEMHYPNLQKAVACWMLNEAEVQKSADQEWEDTKAFYAARVGEKADLIGGEGAVALNVSMNATLVGTCTVVLGGKVLVLETSLKTNYRYGENSANGFMTVYRQVPTCIACAKGFDAVAEEAAKLAAEAAAKNDKKANIKALGEAAEVAGRRKSLWHDLSNGWSAETCWAKLGNAGKPLPTASEAKLGYKEALAAHKAAKLALKAAKA